MLYCDRVGSYFIVAVGLSVAGWMPCHAQALPEPESVRASATALREHYDALGDQLAHNAYGRPLVLNSKQGGDRLSGEVYARLELPYAHVAKALQGSGNWCGILILHLNVKRCHAQPEGLEMLVGRKYDQSLTDAYPLNFKYQLDNATVDYVKASLTASIGPFGTRDYRIAVEAIPLNASSTIVHLRYSYGYGFTARVALDAYMSTIGKHKVGFTVTGTTEEGQPRYVDGVRGLIERNTMRYYLAIEAYASAPAAAQAEQRLNAWFDATERYARQLHEINRVDYMAMKREEVAR